MFELLDFNENPNVGVYCRANDVVVFLQKSLQKKVKKKVSSALDAKLVELTIADSTIIGSLLALNSKGVVVTNVVDKETLATINQQDLEVFVVEDVINAAGNDQPALRAVDRIEHRRVAGAVVFHANQGLEDAHPLHFVVVLANHPFLRADVVRAEQLFQYLAEPVGRP